MPDPVPLRWGRAGDRAGWGAILTIAGGVAVAGSWVYSPWLALLGTFAHVAGWTVLPTTGRRRVVAAIVSTVAVWAILIGPRACVMLALSSCCWMLARHRPPTAWLAALLPAGAGVVIALVLPAGMSAMLPALGVMLAALVGAAWLAAAIARPRGGRMRGTLPADRQQARPADS